MTPIPFLARIAILIPPPREDEHSAESAARARRGAHERRP
jgi:hypothetical protein